MTGHKGGSPRVIPTVFRRPGQPADRPEAAARRPRYMLMAEASWKRERMPSFW
jgi:hypothetical protein